MYGGGGNYGPGGPGGGGTNPQNGSNSAARISSTPTTSTATLPPQSYSHSYPRHQYHQHQHSQQQQQQYYYGHAGPYSYAPHGGQPLQQSMGGQDYRQEHWRPNPPPQQQTYAPAPPPGYHPAPYYQQQDNMQYYSGQLQPYHHQNYHHQNSWGNATQPYAAWQQHPVAPQHYQQAKPSSRQTKPRDKPRPKEAAPKAEPGLKIECKNCDRTFKHKSQLTAHLAMHKVCSYEGCTFSAIPKVLREHVEKVHLKTKEKSVPRQAPQESEAELRAYIEERRANYPTDANIKRKLDRDSKRKDIGQLQPDSENNKRLKRLQDVLKAQKKMGVAKIAGTEKIGNMLTKDGGRKTREVQDNNKSLVPDYSDSENENQERSDAGKKASGNALRKKGNNKRNKGQGKGKPMHQHPRKKEKSLVSKLLSNSIRKEKSHILQCFRFLVKTRFKMATSF